LFVVAEFVHQFIECNAMPVLKNARHERFAQLLASGKLQRPLQSVLA